MDNAEWLTAEADWQRVEKLEHSGYHPLAARLLATRGYDTPEKVKNLLDTSADNLCDPFLLPDMYSAVKRLRTAIENNEIIAVYGDYDADGVTAVCLMLRVLHGLGATCIWHIPSRLSEGYGIHAEALKALKEQGATLLVTVDTGITAHNEADYAKELGFDVIITDHHECRDTLPSALAVINPRRADSPYPNVSLAGVGVAFKLLSALTGNAKDLLARYGDLVALGTIADIMQITGENRLLIHHGLRSMKHSRLPGLRALLSEAGEKPVNENAVSYFIAPRINAAGRMGEVEKAVSLLMTDDPAEAAELARELCEINTKRQLTEGSIMQSALAGLDTESPALVPSGEDWHIGVAGIVCARLASRYDKPVFLICVDGEMSRGSARSVPGINLVEVLSSVNHLLEDYGGHDQAAGFNLKTSNLEEFRSAVTAACAEKNIQRIQVTQIDAYVKPEWLTLDGIESLEELAPYGPGFPAPVFALDDAVISSVTSMGGGKHARLTIECGGERLEAVWFGKELSDEGLGEFVEIAFRPEINHFNKKRKVQLHVAGVRPSKRHKQCEELWETVNRFMEGAVLPPGEAALIRPDRDDMVLLWKTLGSLRVELAAGALSYSRLAYMLSPSTENMGKIWIGLYVLNEMNLCRVTFHADGRVRVEKIENAVKADLGNSRLLKNLKQFEEAGTELEKT